MHIDDVYAYDAYDVTLILCIQGTIFYDLYSGVPCITVTSAAGTSTPTSRALICCTRSKSKPVPTGSHHETDPEDVLDA